MAPAAIHEAPHVQLCRLAAAARRRGLSFDEFWREAVRQHLPLVMTNHPSPPEGAVRWPTDRNDRRAWQHAIYGSRDGWQRAYERQVAPEHESALRVLADGIGMLDQVAGELDVGEPDGLGPRRALPSAA